MKKSIGLLLFGLVLSSCAHHKGGHKDMMKLHHIVNSKHRSEQNKVRNTYRHPVETLRFFEIQSDMKVAEIGPGGGWYTEVLGPYLKDNGELYLTLFSEKSPRPYAAPLNKKIKDMTSDKKLYGKVSYSELEAPLAINDIASDESLDRVLTFRNVHNWMKDGKAKEFFEKFYKALKPGGILGVVEHRAPLNKAQDPKANSGYVREDYVIDLAKSVGFEFVAKSEINANYNDLKNYPNGVWTLPPSLKLKEKDASLYQAIGESDRMTVKFRKPLK